jgi:hypothetical protein
MVSMDKRHRPSQFPLTVELQSCRDRAAYHRSDDPVPRAMGDVRMMIGEH